MIKVATASVMPVKEKMVTRRMNPVREERYFHAKKLSVLYEPLIIVFLFVERVIDFDKLIVFLSF